MDAAEFEAWADRNNLSISDRRDLLREVRTRGEDVADLEADDLEDVARALGILYGAAGKVWRWVRSWFG